MNKGGFFAIAFLLALLLRPAPVAAVCSGGSVGGATQYLSGQLPDIVLREGVAASLNIMPYYVAFKSTGGECGIFARSTVPGTTITDSYCDGSTCQAHPARQYAAVGSAYPVPFGDVAPNSAAGKQNFVPLAFNGFAAAKGTQGVLELAYSGNDFGDLSTAFPIGLVPIYVEGAKPVSAWGRVTSTAASVSGSRLILNHPYLNGKPKARLFVAHVYNPDGGAAGTGWNHPIAVTYDNASARWAITNTDGAAMTAGLGFNFRIDPAAKQVCVPPPGTGSEFTSELVVDDYSANDNIYATLIVTPIDGAPHPVAVKYANQRWFIVYADNAPLPSNGCFNVKVIAFSQYLDDPAQGDLSGKQHTSSNNGVGQDMGPDGANHTIGGIRVLPFSWAARSVTLPMILTSNLTPMGFRQPASSDVKPLSLWITPACPTTSCQYPSRRWAFRHADGTPVPGFVRVNVWAQPVPQPPRASDGVVTPGALQLRPR